ncbi:SDR family oxidoreductase [Phycicoccus sp. MAQZ13P-2]|uniref:SDR family NAD(P)-dependent oxidoreductase n=1 Tax=Phycicoccus mangrovi TaxID=2840470 RepID=UPI001C006574|nr:SDR family oxidoreductase [Phycicoccus mangrovi]MBT9254542.1 SDR family oxidoreductase [Phycicoccus mangrovi]MBT9273253.1 SDR family oxidoreductase [Phycicoccus mangrovi]
MQPTTSRGVLVTGASRGVGAAVARAFAERGDRVVVHHRGPGSADRADEVLGSLAGEGHVRLAADLADPAAVEALAADAVAALGRVDVLVNNAAMIAEPGSSASRRGDHPLDATSYEDWVAVWQRTIATNLLGPANLTWCVARHMLEVAPADGVPVGRVVNVGSRGAYRGEPEIPAYGASKAGLHSFGQSMAQHLGRHGIAVTSIAPGFIATEMAGYAMADPDAAEATRAQSPFRRVARPEEVAAAVVALAEPAAEWASGAVLDFNGASYLR